MALRVRSSGRGAQRQRTVVVRTVVLVLVLLWSLLLKDFAFAHRQTKPSPQTADRFRFQVTDSENNTPISGATVSLVYWQKNATAEEKNEIEVNTDKNGVAEFPRLEAGHFAVTVTVKGYRSYWRSLRSDRSREPIRLRLEKWAKPK